MTSADWYRDGSRGSLRRQRARGYTIVELLMALAVFGVGITGVIALQKVTGASNQHARNLALANHVAQSWIERLAADATTWTDVHPITNTIWLQEVDAEDAWFLPTTSDGFGPRFGALGQPLAADQAAQTVFCTHLRLTMLIDPVGVATSGVPAIPNNGMIRTEVRVFWPRNARAAADYCTEAEVADVGEAVQDFHFVYQATAVRQSRL